MDYSYEDLERWRANYEAYAAHVCSTHRAELVNGEPLELPERSERDGMLAFASSFWIETYLQVRPRGRVFRPAPPFLLRGDPLTIRVPDVAYIELQRLAQHPWTDLCTIAPDLIVEVLSDAAREAEVEARVADFFAAGTTMAWILDDRERTCEVRRRRGQSRVFSFNQKVLAAPVLPHFVFHVYELYGE